MFVKRLQPYAGLLAVVGLLIVFVFAALATSLYVQTRWLAVDAVGLAQSRSLQQMLLRLDNNNSKLSSEIHSHVQLIRDGGERPTRFGSVYVFPKTDDASLRQAANQVDVLINAAQTADLAALRNAFNKFTDAHRQFSERRAQYLWWFQIGSALLALGAFFGILFRLLLRLGKSDQRLATTLSENQNILHTTQDGLFVIDANHQIGEVQSDAARTLFGRDKALSGSFLDLVKQWVSAEEMLEAREYLALLFDCHGRPSLLTDLNPFKKVELKLKSSRGRPSSKFLNFEFYRIDDGLKPGILVAVRNITREVYLRRELNEINDSKREHFENLMSSIVASNEDVSNFYQSSYNTLNEINNIMRDKAGAYADNRHKLRVIHSKIHRIKGNAAMIGMTVVEQSAHSFENKIDQINARSRVEGSALLALTVLLKQMISELEFLEQLSAKLSDAEANKKIARANVVTLTEIPEQAQNDQNKLDVFASEIGRRQGKRVNLELHGFQKMRFTHQVAQQIDALCAQLLRNAIVHGIEHPTLRERRNKPLAGQITVTVKHKDDEHFQLVVRDDGDGLNLKKIQQSAIEQGLISAQDAAALSHTQTVRFIFMSELSTRSDVNLDAGRGYGLDVVRNDVAALGGSIGVRSSRGLFSQFTINLPRSLLLSVVA